MDRQIRAVNVNVVRADDVDDVVNVVNSLHLDREHVVVESLLLDHVAPLHPLIRRHDDVMIAPGI